MYYLRQALRPNIVRHVQLHGGLTYDSKAQTAKKYSDWTLGTTSLYIRRHPIWSPYLLVTNSPNSAEKRAMISLTAGTETKKINSRIQGK